MAKTIAPPPLNAIKNEARSPTKPTISGVLKEAIGSLSAELLRAELEFLCREHPAAISTLESRLLVQGKDVVRYHVDTESEDDIDSENESEKSSSETDSGDNSGSDGASNTKRRPIIKGHNEWTSRMAVCENCEEEFDVTLNERGDCVWHPGQKEADYDADIWADHEPDHHGPYDAFADDPEFAEGFLWDCCDKRGDDEGCKSTKHKAGANVVAPNKKRKAEEETPRASAKKGRQ